MKVSSNLKIISLIAFALFFCPANVFLAIPFVGACALFIRHISTKEGFKKVELDKKSVLLSMAMNLLLLFIFIFRWNTVIGLIPTVLGGLILTVTGSLAIPVVTALYGREAKASVSSDTKLTIPEHLVALVFSFLIITITSSSSPLIAVNQINDPNCLLTVGRGLIHGKIVYRDLIEQKGPILYLINAIGALITPYDFKGVWLMEVIACDIFIVTASKIQKLLSGKKDLITTILIGTLTFVVYSCRCFAYGNTAEEFSIPCIAIALYLCIRCIAEAKIDFKSTVIVGICTAVIFWIKYTICGAIVGIALFILGYLIKRKDFKTLLRTILGVLTGFAIVSLPVIIFFAANHALNDLKEVYFISNIFKYNMGGEADDPVYKLLNPLLMLFLYGAENFHLILMFVIGQIYLSRKSKSVTIMTSIAFVTCFFFAFISSKSYPYYAFVLTPFTIVSWAPISELISENTKKKNAARYAIVIALALITCAASVSESRNREQIGIAKDDYPTYHLSQIIKESDDRSLICYGFLDRGFYTYTETDPDVKYFTYLNADSEHILSVQSAYIATGNYKYIITEYAPVNFEGYELIATDKSPIEDIDYYLYRRIDD